MLCMWWRLRFFLCRLFFFFHDTATTEIYTLSLHDALPITGKLGDVMQESAQAAISYVRSRAGRSEEHTSELQSPDHLVCRLLLEKKKKKSNNHEDYMIKELTTARL